MFQAVKSLRIHRPGAIQTVVSSHGQILIGGLQIQFILNFIASFYNSTVNSNVSVLLIIMGSKRYRYLSGVEDVCGIIIGTMNNIAYGVYDILT